MTTNVSTVSPSTSSVGNGRGHAFRYAQNIYFEDGIWLTGILSGLLFLIVAASLDAARYVPNMGLLIPVTLGAIVMSLLMAYSRFDSFFAFSHGMFIGLAWILYLMAGLVTAEESRSFLEFGFPELQANVYFVLYRLLSWTEMAFGGEPTADNYMFIFEICFLVWWLTYLGFWTIFRHGYTWRAIIPAGVVLLINTYYAPQSTLAFLIAFAFITLLLLVRTNLAEQQVRWRAQRTYFSQDISLDFMRTGFTYALLVLLLAWLAPGLGRSPVVRDLIRPVTEQYDALNARMVELYPSLNRQRRSTTAAFGNSLTLGGERTVGDNIIFTVDTLQGRYWRAVVYDDFDGRGWQNTAELEENFDAATILPVGNWQLRESMTQTITLFSPTGDVVFGAPDITWTDLPLDVRLEPVVADPIGDALPVATDAAGTTSAVEFTYIRSRRTLEVNDSYSVISRQTAVTERALMAATTSYPQAIRDKYLQLPEDFSPLVANRAQEIIAAAFPATGAESITVYEQVKAVERSLRQIPYNDAIPAPSSNQDPIEYFLFELQEGYCDYYATAMATMLRFLGIPARIASGYAEGAYDEESGLFFVTERDAHTWVEVYFPDYGWIEFEPTAGESALVRPSGAEASEFEEPFPSTPPENPGEPPLDPFSEEELLNQGLLDDAPFDSGAFGSGGSPFNNIPWWLWGLMTLVLLLVGIWGLRFIPAFAPTAFTADLPPILYERLQRWTGRLGIRLAETETPYEQGKRLGQALPEGRTMIQQIIQQYVLHRFNRGRTLATHTESNQPLQGSSQTNLETLDKAWQALEPVFWKAWLRRIYTTTIRRRANPFALRK